MPDVTMPRSAENSRSTAPPPRSREVMIRRPLRVLAWSSFVTEVIIIATGGAVRLTGSGLGCSEWPLCTPESLVPTAEQGIHGVIEFANRTMTGVVGLIAIAVLLLVVHAAGGMRAVRNSLWFAGIGLFLAVGAYAGAAFLHLPAFPVASAVVLLATILAAVQSLISTRARRDLLLLAWITLVGVVAQAFVGGITVLTGLNPFIVGFHYIASLLLVCVTAAFLVRMNTTPGPRERAVPKWFAILNHVTGLALAVTIFFGVLTTGSGPHSGDIDVVRQGFDATFLAHVHSWPGYVLAGLVVLLTAAAWALKLEPRRWLLVLSLVIAVQVLVGVWQAREGLPPLFVGIHMVLAALSAAAYTVFVLRLKRPVRDT